MHSYWSSQTLSSIQLSTQYFDLGAAELVYSRKYLNVKLKIG